MFNDSQNEIINQLIEMTVFRYMICNVSFDLQDLHNFTNVNVTAYLLSYNYNYTRINFVFT